MICLPQFAANSTSYSFSKLSCAANPGNKINSETPLPMSDSTTVTVQIHQRVSPNLNVSLAGGRGAETQRNGSVGSKKQRKERRRSDGRKRVGTIHVLPSLSLAALVAPPLSPFPPVSRLLSRPRPSSRHALSRPSTTRRF